MRNIFQGLFKEKEKAPNALILATKISKLMGGEQVPDVLNALCILLAHMIIDLNVDEEKIKDKITSSIQEYVDHIKKIKEARDLS
jgi:hypothetical protein